MFTEKIDPIISNEVATIHGKDYIRNGFGTVSLYWNDDEGQLQTKKLNNLLYFTDSPCNIQSTTALSESKKDNEGTWVLTKREISICALDFGS